ALLTLQAGAAERHALVEGHVVADLRRLADHDPHAVVDEHAAPDARARVYLDAREEPRHVRDEPRRDPPSGAPETVRQPVKGEGVNAGITEHDLEPAPRRRVPLHR